jgi:MoaA/NifB/PqqE/SkfB family radical SAM enzyme
MFDFIYFMLTNECNLHCRFCYADSGELSFNELDTYQIKDFLEKYSRYGGQAIQFTGGEIFLREDIMDIISHARKCNLDTYIITNGTLLTKENINFLKKNNVHVTIGIDGPAWLHDKMRGKEGTYTDILRAIIYFQKLDFPYHVQTLMFYNYLDHQLSWLLDFCKKYHPGSVRLAPISPQGRGKQYPDSHFSFNQLQQIYEASISLSRKLHYHPIIYRNVITKEEMRYFYPNFREFLKPWFLPSGALLPFLSFNTSWQIGTVGSFPELNKKSQQILKNFNTVCKVSFLEASKKDFFCLFDIIQKNAKLYSPQRRTCYE